MKIEDIEHIEIKTRIDYFLRLSLFSIINMVWSFILTVFVIIYGFSFVSLEEVRIEQVKELTRDRIYRIEIIEILNQLEKSNPEIIVPKIKVFPVPPKKESIVD